MKKLATSLFAATVALALACGPEPLPPSNNTDAGTQEQPKFNTASLIKQHLDGKKLEMSGANIPSHPNGLNEDVNYGQATQCYKKVTMTVSAGGTAIQVNSELGTLENAPNAGDTGTCNHDLMSTQVEFSSTTTLIENVKEDGSCFDFTATYTGFTQEGRGRVSADGTTLDLELYFGGKATGHRCADGAVGASTVKQTTSAGPVDFTGNAVQKYSITAL